MVGEFFGWWLSQLADLLPEPWRRIGSRDADAIVIAPAAQLSQPVDSVLVSLRRYWGESMLGRFRLPEMASVPRLAARPAVLRLGADELLVKTLVLPIAAERRVDHVLAFEMDRETPFTADEVFWAHRLVKSDRRTGQICIRLVLLPKLKLAALLDSLARIGIHPRRAEIATGPDAGISLPLEAHRGRQDRARQRLLWYAWASFLALAIAAVAIPFIRQAASLGIVQREIAADRSTAGEAQKLRQEIDRLSASADLIEGQRAATGRPLAILAALTRLLPSDTYLTDLTAQQGKITISGRSAAASRLIASLATAPQLHNPSFAAPVTRVTGAQRELFTITAEIAP